MNPVKIPEIIRIASNISIFAPLVIYVSKIRYANRPIHIIGILVIVSGLCDLVGYILFNKHQSTVVVFNAYYGILFLLLTWFYYEALFINTRRIIVLLGVAVYVLSYIPVALHVQGFTEYQSLMWLITAIIMITYSIAYFFYSLSAIQPSDFFGYSLIWINMGVMIYFCLNLFLFVLGNYVLSKLDPDTGALIWSTHNINNVLKNILFAIGIFFYRRRSAEA